jgi:PIN domain nuclease of toxin-antitoxin system
MDLLLDTHVFLWWDRSDRRLGASASSEISEPANRIFVSAASVWEIAIKRQLGRLAFNGSPSDAIAKNGFHPLPVSGEHAEAAAILPRIHKDPFDRMLIAQSLARNLVLVTSDDFIRQYAVPQLWAR